VEGVSVIIPVLNCEKYIGEAIESVLSQEYEGPVEIIVSDDASMDRSIEIAKSFGDHVRVLHCPEGARHCAGAARNRGLVVAKYPYVAFLDSDDIYLPGHLNSSVRFLANNPNVVMVIDQAYGMNAAGEQRWTFSYPIFGTIPAEMILLDQFFPINAVVLRKTLLGNSFIYAFDEDLRFAEDYDLWLRIAEHYSVATIRGGGVAVRDHDTRSTSNHLVAYTYMTIAFKKALDRYSYPNWIIRKRKAALAYRLAEGHYRKGAYLKSMLLALKAAILDPLRAIYEVWKCCKSMKRSMIIGY